MPSCWLEAVVLLLGQTFGLAADDVRPTLAEPTYQMVLRETIESECQSLGDPDDWPTRARQGWRQLILSHLEAADQDPAGDRLFARAVRMHSLTSQVDHKIAEGDLALWMQLGVTEPTPGHLVSVCRALLAKSTRSSEPAIQILQSDLGIDPRWKPFAQDLRQRFDLPSVRNCCESAIQTQAFLNASGFPSGELGLQWRSDIRDTRIRLLNPATRAQAWHESRVYDVLHPVVDLLGRVGSRESEVLLQGVEQLRASLLRTASASLLDTSGVDRLAVVVDQFVKRTEMDPDQGGRLFRRLFPELRIQIRSADREMLSRLPEILGGREVLLDPGRQAVYERFRTRSNLLGYAQSLEEWCMRWCEIFPQDRERLETVLQAALAGATDPVLGDDSLKWIELFLDRSKALYPKALESELSEVPWLSRTHSALQEQLADARDRWWKSVLQGDGDAGDLRPFEVLQLIEALLQADQQLPHGHCVPRSLLKTELQLLQKELPAAMLQTDEQRDVVLARAPLVDLTVRLAKAHPELESDALQAFVRDALELVPDPFAERRADLDYVIRYAIEASLLDERGLELPALQLRQGCAATIRSLQLRYGV
jgi:polyhydroxyalkanoate synthesis regulator phasin